MEFVLTNVNAIYVGINDLLKKKLSHGYHFQVTIRCQGYKMEKHILCFMNITYRVIIIYQSVSNMFKAFLT